MKRIFTVLILLVSFYIQSHAQTLSNQCESSPCNALPICGTATISQPFAFTSVGNPPGSPLQVTSCINNLGTLSNATNNWVFYRFTCYSGGDFNFLITPNQTLTNLNWALWDITTSGCGNLGDGFKVACNFNGSTAGGGITGCGVTTSAIIELTYSMQPGTYILGVQRPGTGGTMTTGFTIDFTGTTADIAENTQPALASVLPITSCGPVTSIKVLTNKPVKCAQVGAGDFAVTGASVITATTNNCPGCTNAAPNNTNTNYSNVKDTITLNFAAGLSAGNHTLSLTANGVFSDICGNLATNASTVVFNVPAYLNDSIKQGYNCATNTYIDTIWGTGGTAPYQYKITTNTTSPPPPANNGIYTAATSSFGVFSGLYGGVTYTLAVLDANGCKDSTIITPNVITPLGAPNLAASQIVSPPCYNQFNLDTIFATINTSTGVGPYTWSLASSPAGVASTGSSTSPIGNFRKWYGLSGFTSSATFTVTVKDSYGCTRTGTAMLINPPQLVLPTLTSTNPLCFGDSSGTITCNNTFAFLGGTPAYTYVINPSFSNTSQSGPSLNIFNNLPGAPTPGIIYTVTVQDSKGCTASNSKAITSNAAIVIKTTNSPPPAPVTFVNPTCVTPCGGWIRPTATGGQGSKKFYLYNSTMTGFIDSSTNTATSVLGTFSGLCPGTYTVMAKDVAGCTATTTYTLALPPIPDLVQDSLTNVLCFGACTGKAFTTTTGVSSPFTYAITPNNNAPCGNAVAGTGVNLGDYSNLPTGNYKIVVTSQAATAALGNGCKDSVSFFISQPPSAVAITAVTKDSVQCFGQNNGLINVIASGGTGVITYKITPLGPQTNTTGSFIGLTAQCYTVTATDANGCSTTSSVCVGQPLVVNATSTKISDVSCFGLCDGTGKVKPTGGNGNFTYLVTGGSGTPLYNTSGDSCMISNLCVGTYTILSTDSKGCSKTTTLTITQPTAITTVKSQVNVSCFGQCTGTATVTPSGGKGGFYNYFITSSPLGSSPTINASGTVGTLANLCSGTYIVETKDSNACTKIDTFIITQPATALTATASQGLPITCNSVCNATGTVTPTGGTPNYSYLIVNATGNINSSGALGSLTNLCADTYTINVTDSKSCTTSVTLTITQPSPLVINTATSDSIACFGLITGAVHFNVTGGTGTITYTINPSGPSSNTTGNFTGLAAGCYTVTAKDANLCSITSSICVGQPLLLTANSFKIADATCNGYCDGSGTVTPLNGNGNYTYTVSAPASATTLPTFNNAGNVCNLSSLCAGTYTINVTDSKGCTASTTLLISQPNSVVPSYSTVQTPTCTPGCDGQAQVSATGGNGIYTFISITPTTASISATGLATGLCAGTAYTVIVNDGNSCSGSVVINLSTAAGSSALNIVNQLNPSCLPGCDGSATVLAVGGSGTITYSIQSPAGSTCLPSQAISGTFNNLGTGTYTVIAADANNCTQSNTFTLVNPSAAAISVLSTTNASCSPGCDGTATMNNVPNMVYTISPAVIPAIAGNNISGLCSGVLYTITGTSNLNGCTSTTTVQVGTLNGPAAPTVVSSTPASCNPGCDGTLLFNSAVALTYGFTPAGPTAVGNNVSGLCAGTTYTVTGADATGCTVQTTIQVSTTNASPISVLTSTNASCNPGCDGTAIMTNVAGMNYTISPSINTSIVGNTISGLCAGTLYTIQGTDLAGCTTTTTVQVGTTASPTVSVTGFTNVSISGLTNGTITALGAGGTPGYNYSISPLTPATITQAPNGTFNGLDTICYTIQVTDSKGCTGLTTQCISSPPPSSCTFSKTDETCFGLNNGTITAINTGGVPPYTVTANGGSILTGLAPANYLVVITDANGGSCSSNLTIASGTQITMNAPVIASPTCIPGCDGTIAITANSSTVTALTYQITPPAGSTCNTVQTSTGVFTNVGTGNYVITATDINGCSSTTNILVTTPGNPVIDSIKKSNLSCNNFCNGKITVYAAGVGYTYSKNNGLTFQNSNVFDSLCIGTYTIIVKSSFNCTASTSVTLTQPSPIVQVTSSFSSPSCHNQNNGTITFIATGGTGVIVDTITPNPIGSTQFPAGTFNNLPAGTYTVTARDSNLCAIIQTYTLINPPLLAWDNTSSTNITCNGANDGKINVSVTGGTNPITYTINGNPGTSPFINLNANTYTIQATDAKGCSITTSFTIVQPPAIIFNLPIITNNICFGGSDGIINITATGGNPGFIYSLNPNNAAPNTTGVFNNLPTLPLPQAYTVTAVDASGCSKTTTVSVSQPPALVFNPINVQNVACFGGNTGAITAIANGGTGLLTNSNYSILPVGSGIQTSPGFFTGLTAGSYTINVTDANNCVVSTIVTITQNPAIGITSYTSTEPICNGDANGSLSIAALGGVSPYVYYLDGGVSNSSGLFTGLIAKSYTITIQDALGCTKDTIVQVTEPTAVGAKFVVTDASCIDSKDGKLFVTGTGGRGGYKYYITPGLNINKSGIFSGLEAGTYTLRVVDTAGCEYTNMFTINPPSNPLNSVITKQDLGCTGKGNEGQATANVSGGTPPYTYVWFTNPAQTTPVATQLYFGSYNLQVTDANGCVIYDTVKIEAGPCCEIAFIPNAFSPNGDGKNDVFRILSTAAIQVQQLDIYDRWGKRVWSTIDYRRGWDGTVDGEQAPLATYQYIFRYKCLTDNNTYTKKGDVILVR